MWAIIEQYGHSFGKRHVVTALYQLGLCRQYERRATHPDLTSALVDRLVQVPARDLTSDEATRALWAMSILEEVRSHAEAHRFALELLDETIKRFHEFSPPQMATFVQAMSKLVRSSAEDEQVARLTTVFSDYALGSGALPRFPPEELRTWTQFLQFAASQGTPALGQSQFVPPLGLGFNPLLAPMGCGLGQMPMLPMWPGMAPFSPMPATLQHQPQPRTTQGDAKFGGEAGRMTPAHKRGRGKGSDQGKGKGRDAQGGRPGAATEPKDAVAPSTKKVAESDS